VKNRTKPARTQKWWDE